MADPFGNRRGIHSRVILCVLRRLRSREDSSCNCYIHVPFIDVGILGSPVSRPSPSCFFFKIRHFCQKIRNHTVLVRGPQNPDVDKVFQPPPLNPSTLFLQKVSVRASLVVTIPRRGSASSVARRHRVPFHVYNRSSLLTTLHRSRIYCTTDFHGTMGDNTQKTAYRPHASFLTSIQLRSVHKVIYLPNVPAKKKIN